MVDIKFSYLYLPVLIVMCGNIASINSEEPIAKKCGRRSANYDDTDLEQSFKELLMGTDSLKTDILNSELDPANAARRSLGALLSMPIDVNDDVLKTIDSQKSLACAQMQCTSNEVTTAICSCNYNTGNVVTFKNACEMKKHNCRFDTSFHAILNEICPWEFQSRRGFSEIAINYDDPKYYN